MKKTLDHQGLTTVIENSETRLPTTHAHTTSPRTDATHKETTLAALGAASGPASFNVGFLTLMSDPSGVVGGYLLTNAWGRPLEFRMSTAVQPNRVQQILYGPTLTEYLHTDLIGKTLIEKTAMPPALLVTDSVHALALRGRLNLPVLAIDAAAGSGLVVVSHPRSSVPLAYLSRYAADRAAIEERLERVDPAVDLAEPFARIREAVAEARKMGVTTRAA